MVWQKQVKITKGKKKETEPVKKKKTFEGNFLDDWIACRQRHKGPTEVLKAVFEEKMQYVFYRAGRKGAKTTTAIDIAWRKALEAPNRVGYLCYPTIAQGIEVVWEERRLQTCDQKNDEMFEKYVEKVDDNKHLLRFRNGSFVKLIGTWTEARGRGTQPDFIIYDEFQDCNPDYVEAMDANLAAKEFSQCIVMGTPPKKRNHYEEWFERIYLHPKGKVFHYTSYDNISLPHLKEWLDSKHQELIKTNKEDVWLREYMAELCYSSAERVLPDAKFTEKDDLIKILTHFDYKERIPVLAISCHPTYFSAILGVFLLKKTMFILDHLIVPQVWNQSFQEMYPLLGEKAKEIQDLCHQKLRQIVWDDSGSFIDVVSGFTPCRKDSKWQYRGIPLLREMMVKDKIKFSRNVADYGLECQNLLIEESMQDIQKNYPMICTTAMMVNEYFAQEKIKIPTLKPFDKYEALREMGIPCPTKRYKNSLFKINK